MHLELTLDSVDPRPLAAFWAAALGYTPQRRSGPFWPLVPADGRGPRLLIQAVDEPKVGKNRMHLDLHVADLDAEVARLEALGARRLDHDVAVDDAHRWSVMVDPEGNEFCVVAPRDVANPSGGATV